MGLTKIIYFASVLVFTALAYNAFAYNDANKKYICSLPNVTISINGKKVLAKTSCTAEQQKNGLMWVKKLPENNGMIFVFEKEEKLNFWAKNTYIPLDLAYINDKLEIVEIRSLKPLDTTIVTNNFPASYVLEVNAGWFKRNNIKIGDKLKIH